MRPTNRFLWPATVLLGSLSASSAQPLIDHVDVFASGSEGYHTFRIPAVVRAPDGSLLAFVEGRKENRRDPGGGDIDLVAKRSKDRGASWSPLQIVDDPGEGWSASNPTPVVEQNSGRVLIVYNRWEPGFGTILSQPGTDNNQVWLRYSDDHGGNWSEPREITREARDHEDWGAMFLGACAAEIDLLRKRIIGPYSCDFSANRTTMRL